MTAKRGLQRAFGRCAIGGQSANEVVGLHDGVFPSRCDSAPSPRWSATRTAPSLILSLVAVSRIDAPSSEIARTTLALAIRQALQVIVELVRQRRRLRRVAGERFGQVVDRNEIAVAATAHGVDHLVARDSAHPGAKRRRGSQVCRLSGWRAGPPARYPPPPRLRIPRARAHAAPPSARPARGSSGAGCRRPCRPHWPHASGRPSRSSRPFTRAFLWEYSHRFAPSLRRNRRIFTPPPKPGKVQTRFRASGVTRWRGRANDR